jgi:hypothetical protein
MAVVGAHLTGGADVIRDGTPFETQVIPAKAGIQLVVDGPPFETQVIPAKAGIQPVVDGTPFETEVIPTKAGIQLVVDGTPFETQVIPAKAGIQFVVDGTPFETQVIPAKAGIQPVVLGAFPMICGVDSRFRGNDCAWERPCIANDFTTRETLQSAAFKSPDDSIAQWSNSLKRTLCRSLGRHPWQLGPWCATFSLGRRSSWGGMR